MLCLNNIAKKYKDKIALEHVSLELDNGIYGLLGPNGAGKSTLMNIITGNIKPSDGQVLWDGHDIKILGSKYRSIIGYAPQQQGLYNTFTGKRFLSYMATLKGIPKKDMSREIDRVLEYVNMTEDADRAIGTYSGGMKQRILIAQAVLGNPKLIVLDEPTVGLDPKERVRIRERISELAGEVLEASSFEAEWSAREGSRYFESPLLYRENGFRKEEDARALIAYLKSEEDGNPAPFVRGITKKQEKKNPPLLYNLAELQNDCSRFFKLSPDQTLDAAQTLYERKLTTYPRTDARVLSSAVAKEIDHNLKGVGNLPQYRSLVRTIAESGSWKSIGKTKYTNDKAITDHYAIIPTGEGLNGLKGLTPTLQKVYDLIVRRFLAIFYPAAVFDKMTLQVGIKSETLTASLRVCKDKGYLICQDRGGGDPENAEEAMNASSDLEALIKKLKKGDPLFLQKLDIKEGETSPPKRYTGGSMILTMENAGQFIEDDELREQIKGAGIGTSATRAGDVFQSLVDIYVASAAVEE